MRKPFEPQDKDQIKGVKNDDGKLLWRLLPMRELSQVVRVLTFGAKKYAPDNWKYILDSESRYFDAAMRHISARQLGEINDQETRQPHLAHAICCLLFWAWHDNTKRRGHR